MDVEKALLIIDLQNDFCPAGRLAVSGGDKIIPVLNEYIKIFLKNNLPIFASRDWHPKQTKHFKPFGGLWPAHCVKNTKGAEFHPELKLPKETIILSKGMDAEKDSYSAFQAIDPTGRNLLTCLKKLRVSEFFAGGLAADYCVKASVLDGLKLGFKVNLMVDAIAGVNAQDSKNAIAEMTSAGAREVSYETVLCSLK